MKSWIREHPALGTAATAATALGGAYVYKNKDDIGEKIKSAFETFKGWFTPAAPAPGGGYKQLSKGLKT